MRTCVSGRERRPIEQSRATTGEQSRERPSRPLLAQKLARTSLPHQRPPCPNQVAAHHTRLHCPFWQHMQGAEAPRWAYRAQTDRVCRDFVIFWSSSPREERFALASPAPIFSRTSPPLHPLSAHDGAQDPFDGACPGRSGSGPAALSARILFARHHHPHLALLDGTAIPILTGRIGPRGMHSIPKIGGPSNRKL